VTRNWSPGTNACPAEIPAGTVEKGTETANVTVIATETEIECVSANPKEVGTEETANAPVDSPVHAQTVSPAANIKVPGVERRKIFAQRETIVGNGADGPIRSRTHSART
jgi:hypothetical protein